MQKKATEEVNIENKDKVNVNDTFEEENIKYKYVVKITKLNKVRTVNIK